MFINGLLFGLGFFVSAAFVLSLVVVFLARQEEK